MKNYNILIWIALLIFGIIIANFIWEASVPAISGIGTVRFVDLERGFYGIEGDDGKKYDPINLAPEFQQNGLRVEISAKERKDVASIHMWGTIVEIVKIKRAPDETAD
ncbi:MAG: hypothetical protein HY443_01580 [Candidatus Nealsonbacteria bacterium]|nr:hypothetical protein [Candidatus Nealsonbacteria bacterium]